MRLKEFVYFYCLSLAFFPLQAEKLDEIPETSSSSLAATLTAFESEAKKTLQAWNVPGMAIAIVKGDKTIYSKGFGVTELMGNQPVTPHTLFEIGSLSKSFTSALMAIMIDEGRLTWEDSVIKYMPEFVLYDPWVTREFQIQDLMSQRSGLPSHAGDTQAYFGFTRQQMIHNLRYIKPISSFRSAYAYQNSFFLVAGEMLEIITGLSWEQLIQQRIFAPLGMKDSSTSIEKYKASKNASALHKRLEGKVEKLSEDLPYRYIYTLFGPAGGINSTAIDMANWLKLLINEGSFNGAPLISSSNLSRTFRRYIYVGRFHEAENYYGLGWAIRDYAPYPIIWHDGVTAGVANIVAFIPEANIGIVILTNTSGTSLSHALAWQFFDLYFNKSQKNWNTELLEKHILAESQKAKALQPPSEPKPALPLDHYTGIYFHELFGKVEVESVNQQLIITIGPDRVRFNLEHWNRDTFELIWPALKESETIFVNFCIDSKGYADQLSIPLLMEGEAFKRL
ncbi:serine hydrolase [Candidatus Protochlamydia phocaeensis]|uniref:serine hydrolase n=1 Tax=Candidatus Protochlamydia phocaeensis TaxID=1414722 RepID=UPI0008387F62|nr:serine hydrolase [Candidatus Protochlamydia phocaeensis]